MVGDRTLTTPRGFSEALPHLPQILDQEYSSDSGIMVEMYWRPYWRTHCKAKLLPLMQGRNVTFLR